ncbi:hypothetical protein EZH22_06020 [Xanthobacter dioxanivorans]|uniref:Uncharacterized protein n=1 Tax=Xanthobacter dioxanivorans TaxID=2528964 RepID=A0A974PQQ4_9HYPH|nr:hypothetical protein [Xanthobacter dioxanivorans]QRG07920.1 hypothetical protein EZH22_06020 [Xanthobacter dioxanivorans]
MRVDQLLDAAVEDARERHKAVIELIRFTDQQAISLLNFHAALGVALVSGAAACLGKDPLVPAFVGIAFGAGAICFIAGAWCALKVQASATISLPGREPKFWIWAAHGEIGNDLVFEEYMNSLARGQIKNDEANIYGVKWLKRARACVFAAPIAAISASGAAYFSVNLLSLVTG